MPKTPREPARPKPFRRYHESSPLLPPTRILRVVRAIPRGRVTSYGQVAFLAGLPGRARLVGKVLGEVGASDVPWQRVVNAQGRIALPKASTAHAEQRMRLRDEGIVFRGDRIDLRIYQWRPLDDSPLLDD